VLKEQTLALEGKVQRGISIDPSTIFLTSKGLSIKDVRSQGFIQCGHFADKGGSSDADVCTL